MNRDSIRSMGHARAVELAGGTTLFGGLDADELRLLLDGSSTKVFARQEIVLWPGEGQARSLLVLAGRVWLCRESLEAKLATLPEAVAGTFIPTVPPRTTIRAIENGTIVCLLLRRQYRVIAQRHPKIAEAVEEMLVRCIAEAFDRIEDLTFEDVAGRVEHALERRRASGLPLTREELATLVGASRQQVTAALNRLREAGTIEYESGRRGIETGGKVDEDVEFENVARGVK